MNIPKLLSKLTALSFLAMSAVCMGATNTNSLTPEQIDQVKKVIHDYLVTNPQVLIEASQALQKQESKNIEQKAQSAISENANALFANASSPVSGNPKGDVTIVEFFDAQCPHCKDMGAVLEKLKSKDSNVRIIYKELPIFGSSSRDAALAALAAQKQGADKYEKLHHALLAEKTPLNKEKIMEIAKSSGLDINKLKNDMNSDSIKQEIEGNFKLAQVLGLAGTPTFVISKWQVGATNNSVNGAIFLPGMVTLEDLQQLVTQVRQNSVIISKGSHESA